MKTVRILGTLALTGAIITLGPVGSAMAADDQTSATFSLTAAGGLTISAPTDATWGVQGGSGATSAGGSLGPVTIEDQRGVITGWAMSASSSPFTNAASSSQDVEYTSGAATLVEAVTATGLAETSIMTEATVANGTDAAGNNTATFTPDIAVTLPTTSLTGTYTGTVTTSVL